MFLIDPHRVVHSEIQSLMIKTTSLHLIMTAGFLSVSRAAGGLI